MTPFFDADKSLGGYPRIRPSAKSLHTRPEFSLIFVKLGLHSPGRRSAQIGPNSGSNLEVFASTPILGFPPSKYLSGKASGIKLAIDIEVEEGEF